MAVQQIYVKVLGDVAISKTMAEQWISEFRFVSTNKVIAACIWNRFGQNGVGTCTRKIRNIIYSQKKSRCNL